MAAIVRPLLYKEPQACARRVESADEKLLYNTDFDSCLDSNGQPISTGKETLVSFPMAGDFDFMCINCRVQHPQGHHRRDLQGRRQLSPPVTKNRHPPTQLTKN